MFSKLNQYYPSPYIEKGWKQLGEILRMGCLYAFGIVVHS